jgi:hypothetical protein
MAQRSHPSKAQMNTHLLLEALIAATSVVSLSSSLAGLWVAKSRRKDRGPGKGCD